MIRMYDILKRNENFANSNKEQITKSAKSQNPVCAVVSCSDSRVPPELLFEAKLGELFTIRTAGGIIDNAGLASLEYAIEYLNVKTVLVLGHTNCGAVTHAQEELIHKHQPPSHEKSHLDDVISEIYKNIEGNKQNLTDLNHAIIDNLKAQVNKINEDPVISRSNAEILLYLYNIETGTVSQVKKDIEFNVRKKKLKNL